MSDLKKVYGAVNEETALYKLESFAAKWDAKYTKISVSQWEHRAELSIYFKYPQPPLTCPVISANMQLRADKPLLDFPARSPFCILCHFPCLHKS